MVDVLPLKKNRTRRQSPREGRIRCPAHLDFIRTLPCIVTGSPVGVVAHHLLFAEPSAMGSRSGDEWAVPLVETLHGAEHPYSVHRFGDERAWWAGLHVDPLPIARFLWLISIAAGRTGATNNECLCAAMRVAGWENWVAQNYGRPRRAA